MAAARRLMAFALALALSIVIVCGVTGPLFGWSHPMSTGDQPTMIVVLMPSIEWPNLPQCTL